MSLWCKEVNDGCRNDDPDGEDDICQDMNVGCLDVDIIVEGGSSRLH